MLPDFVTGIVGTIFYDAAKFLASDAAWKDLQLEALKETYDRTLRHVVTEFATTHGEVETQALQRELGGLVAVAGARETLLTLALGDDDSLDRIETICRLHDLSYSVIFPVLSNFKEQWRSELHFAAERPDSPLFPLVVLAFEHRIEQKIEAVDRKLGDALSSGAFTTDTQRRDFYERIQYPPSYVVRRELLTELKAILLETSTASVAFVSALHGMGGIGKSVVARALCDEAEIQSAFEDGILWTELGQTPDLVARLREWVERLGGVVTETAATVDTLKDHLARLLQNRSCLLIIDDVWDSKHLEAFQVLAPHCRLLITTRNAAIARDAGADVRYVPPMTETEAVDLLDKWVGTRQKIDFGIKRTMVERLCYLPLAVKLAGAQLQTTTAETWLREFEDLHDLETEWRTQDPKKSLIACFDLSLKMLDERDCPLYVALAIFREHENAPAEAIARLWGEMAGLSVKQTHHLIDHLAACALLELVIEGERRAIKLHDLLREFIGDRLGAAGAEAAHEKLLGAYRKTRHGEGWHTAADDGYLYGHLAYHLQAVKHIDELRALFASQDWQHTRVPYDGYIYDGYLNDLAIAWTFAEAKAFEQAVVGEHFDAFVECYRYCLVQTSVNSVAGNYVPEIVRRAVELGIWDTKRALSVAMRVPIDDRVAMCVALLKTNALSSLQTKTAQVQALAAALAIRNEDVRAEVLGGLAGRLAEDQVEQMLAAVLAIQDEDSRAEALSSLAERLTGDHVERALAAALAIKAEWRRAMALSSLVRQLSGTRQLEVIEQALAAALGIRNEDSRAEALSSLAERLAGDQVERTLAAALAIRDEDSLAKVLSRLAVQLSGDQVERALAAARAIQDAYSRAEALSSLAGQMSGARQTEVVEQALAAALAIKEEWGRAEALSRLAGQMSGARQTEVIEQALAAALAIRDAYSRAEVLSGLAGQMSGARQTEVIEQALAAALAIKEEWSCAEALSGLARQLSGDQVERVLAAALAIRDEYSRAEALSGLAGQMSGALVYKSLAAARE